MSTSDLARRLGSSPASVRRSEAAEQTGRIRLADLDRCADALGCDLVYMLVPRQAVEETVDARARSLAHAELQSLAHTMDLSGKGLDPEFLYELEAQLAVKLKAQPGLWLE